MPLRRLLGVAAILRDEGRGEGKGTRDEVRREERDEGRGTRDEIRRGGEA